MGIRILRAGRKKKKAHLESRNDLNGPRRASPPSFSSFVFLPDLCPFLENPHARIGTKNKNATSKKGPIFSSRR